MLIKCPECKKAISDRALSCSTCGYPINSGNIIEGNTETIIRYPVLPYELIIGW